ncbi:MAG TPA: TetR/AcrR family transcriptional regulator [Caulobacterales bacterium]|nr:TetR/AcrR family transcriptional regulator [Caulobacterales bacterium]
MGKSGIQMRRGAGRLSAEESAKLGDRLLDAAQALFVEKGFENTTMEEIARRAGSSTQTIYSRHASKRDVLEAVARRVVERTVAAHAAAVTLDPRGVAPRDYLISLGSQIVSTLTHEAVGLTRLAFAEAHRSPEIQKQAQAGYGRGVGLIRAALTQWREDGKISPHGDLDRLALLCLSMMTDRARIGAVIGAPMPPEEARAYVEQAVDVFLHGCG